MPTKTLKPLPHPLRYLQPFVNNLAKLGPEGHREHDINAAPLDSALRKRIRGLDRRSAETRLAEDRGCLATWLRTTGGRHHPAYWILGYLSSSGLASWLRRPPPTQPRGPEILFEPPDGWVVKPGRSGLGLKQKRGVAGSIEAMDVDESDFGDLRRLLKQTRPAARPRGAPKVTNTTSNIRRGGCSGTKCVSRWSKPAPAKHVQYLLRVPGGHVLIAVDGTGHPDFDESPLESKLHTLRVRRRRA